MSKEAAAGRDVRSKLVPSAAYHAARAEVAARAPSTFVKISLAKVAIGDYHGGSEPVRVRGPLPARTRDIAMSLPKHSSCDVADPRHRRGTRLRPCQETLA